MKIFIMVTVITPILTINSKMKTLIPLLAVVILLACNSNIPKTIILLLVVVAAGLALINEITLLYAC